MRLLNIKKKNKAYSVYEDSEYLGIIYKSDFDKAGIDADNAEGETEVDDDTVKCIRDIVSYRAYDKGVSLLTDSEKCAEDIRLKLRMKSFPDYAIEEAISLLYEYNYLNDERFAEAFVRTYMNQKSKSMIIKELGMRHVNVPSLSEIIDRVYDEEDMTEDKAIDRLMKRFEGQDMSDDKTRRRAAALLIRHGFSFEQINNRLT